MLVYSGQTECLCLQSDILLSYIISSKHHDPMLLLNVVILTCLSNSHLYSSSVLLALTYDYFKVR